MKIYKNKHFEFKLRIRRFRKFGLFPIYKIEKQVNHQWFSVLEFNDCDLKVAQEVKKVFIKNPDLIKNPFEAKFTG